MEKKIIFDVNSRLSFKYFVDTGRAYYCVPFLFTIAKLKKIDRKIKKYDKFIDITVVQHLNTKSKYRPWHMT